MNHRAEYLVRGHLLQKLLSVDTHTQRTDCSTWTTKVVGKYSEWRCCWRV